MQAKSTATSHDHTPSKPAVKRPKPYQHDFDASLAPARSVTNLRQPNEMIYELEAIAAPGRAHYDNDEEQGVRADQNGPVKRISKSISLGPPITAAETNWQLPTLQFRPLSFSQTPPDRDDRPKSSTGNTRADQLGILCPTPERSISSQSNRNRFSKILDLEDRMAKYSPLNSEPGFQGRQYTPGGKRNLRATKFAVAPIPERNSETGEMLSNQDSDVFRQSREINSSQNTDWEKSTIESLLDRHIESLGLKAETDGADSEVSEPLSRSTPGSSLDVAQRTPRLSDLVNDDRWKRHVRSATTAFEGLTSFNSPYEMALVPQKLFHGTVTQNAGIRNKAAKEGSNREADRPSKSWMTLPSTSQGSRSIDQMRRLSESAVSYQPDSKTAFFDLGSSKNSLSPIHFQRSLIRSSVHNTLSIPRKTQRDSALWRQISYRRKLRLRLKSRKQSRSRSHSGSSRANVSVHIVESSLRGTYAHLEPTTGLIRSLTDTNDSIFATKGSSVTPLTKESLGSVPLRQNSQIESHTTSFDVTRKASTRTARSQNSSISLINPINSTRVGSQYLHLTVPDGLPITPRIIGAGIGGQLTQETSGPALREAKSFFSDGSSQRYSRNSVRQKLHGLRKRLTISPKNSNDPLLVKEQHQRSIRAVRQSKLGQARPTETGETKGMSDFAYTKRKWTERFKEWWQRHRNFRKSHTKDELRRFGGVCCDAGTPSTL